MESKQATMETGATAHPNVAAIRDYQAAMANGEYEKAILVFDPEVTYTVPGKNGTKPTIRHRIWPGNGNKFAKQGP